MANRIENPELDRRVREMAELAHRGALKRGQLEPMIQDAVIHCGVSEWTVRGRYEVERARLEGPAAYEPVAALIDKELDREEELERGRRRRKVIRTYKNDIELLARDETPEARKMALERLETLRALDPKSASELETELGLKT